ncbi:MAG: hypothetical protein JW863_09675 [Chitinispirillaceae bacterium]|nr:hypothetical protein [Chitinispirillaceae bacterium]
MKRTIVLQTHQPADHPRHPPLWLTVVFLLVLQLPVFAGLPPEDLEAIKATGLTALTGEQEGEYPARDYLVVETVRIPRGDTVTFAAGSRVYFHRNARITVFGALRFMGVPRKKITLGKLPFSLPKLSTDRAMVFDSTSIYTYEHSQLTLRHTVIIDSSVKVRFTDTTSGFIFDTLTCTDNYFLLPDTSLFFPAKSTVTCSLLPDKPYIPCKPVLADTTAMQSGRFAFTINPIIPVRIVLGVGIAAAAGASYYFNYKADKMNDEYNAGDETTDFNRLYEQQDNYFLYRNLALAAGACTSAGFAITFLFGGHHK